MTKYVYMFSEGNKDMRELLGGKGANLAEMTNIGLPVPSGFTVSTEACTAYYENGGIISDEIKNEIFLSLEKLENLTGKKIGDINNPLLVSVRSGSRASMPGMMDTVLNLGMSSNIAEALKQRTGNAYFAYDSYRRFIQMYSDVVKGFPKKNFEGYYDEFKKVNNIIEDTALTEEHLKAIIKQYKDYYREISKEEFPEDPKVQLIQAVEAVFKSWNNDRAKSYRRMYDIPSSWGTAVNIQEMVYGNMGNTSGTGVAFTRNPANGEKELYGEYLINAQGEDVVAGIRTPQDIKSLASIMPEVYNEFQAIATRLETYYKDVQDMEFTIENGKLFMLQTRNGKRTAFAAVKIAVDLVNEGLITKEEALLMVNPSSLDQLLHSTFDKEVLENTQPVATGLAASPGAASGKIYFTASSVVKAHEAGEKDILLVREETSPEDIDGMKIAVGILTVRGGMTSHAAVVARGMGTCCVSGCGSILVDEEKKTITLPNKEVLTEGDYLSLDGSTGHVYKGQMPTVSAEISGDFKTFMSWADEVRTLHVRANADTPKDALKAIEFGAEGIGLCRTEHMFFDEDRIFKMRKMIVSPDQETRVKTLNELLPLQRTDFEEIFKVMSPNPVIIRYLDPPLHEFIPHTDEEIRVLASSLGKDFESIKNNINELKEFNPMMGHRGCRLAVTYPEIAMMQTRAVMEAAVNVTKNGTPVIPEIMIPLIGDTKEYEYVKNIVDTEAKKVLVENGINIKYMIGTMIEIPRACIIADKLASLTEFFSFGTNDLTQMTYGFSRDDASKFLNDYYDKNIFETDPFQTIDEEGVGQLVELAVHLGKKANPNIELGICGEHAGDSKTVEFCHNVGLDYVSCSPYRIPIAKLAAAQAAIKAKKNN